MLDNSIESKSDFSTKFAQCKDFAKFIDEFEELLEYLDTKYPSFRSDIEKDLWISRIIKDHYNILLSLSAFLGSSELACFNEYLKSVERRPFLKYLFRE